MRRETRSTRDEKKRETQDVRRDQRETQMKHEDYLLSLLDALGPSPEQWTRSKISDAVMRLWPYDVTSSHQARLVAIEHQNLATCVAIEWSANAQRRFDRDFDTIFAGV